FDRGLRRDARVGGLAQSFRLGRAAHDARLRRHRLGGRLQEDHQQGPEGHRRPSEVFLADRVRTRRRGFFVRHRAHPGGNRADTAALQEYFRAARTVFYPACLLRDRRLEQRREPHRRPRWPRHHAVRDGGERSRHLRLRHRQRQLLQLPRLSLYRGRRRSAGDLRGDRRRRSRVPLVQYLSRDGVHGRHRRARARRGARRHRRRGAPGSRALHHGRALRDGDALGDAAGRLLQDDGQAHLPHGAAASSLRAQGLAGTARDRALLDHFAGARLDRPRHVETSLMAAARAMHRTNPKRVLVVGLGTTGFSCVRYLAARGYDVSVTDSREAPPNLAELEREFPDVPVHTGGFAADWFIRAEMLVVSPGISLREPAIARALAAGCEAVGDIELFARAVQERTNVAGGRMPHRDVSMPRAQGEPEKDEGPADLRPGERARQEPSPGFRAEQDSAAMKAQERPPGATEAKAPVLAITGANGKSTVTSLVGDICRAAGLDTRVGGNIGVPALSLLGPEEPDVYVLELSSFQLETTTSLNARAATVLNLTPDHMDRY